MSAQPLPRLTPEEYLAAERAAEHKSEYYDGYVYAMAGGTPNHSLIAHNLHGEFHIALRGRGYRVYTSDLRVRSTPSSYSYPDITVVCGHPQLATSEKDVL